VLFFTAAAPEADEFCGDGGVVFASSINCK
jgi:hypothetical protein